MNRQQRSRNQKLCNRCARPIVIRAVIKDGKEYCSPYCAQYQPIKRIPKSKRSSRTAPKRAANQNKPRRSRPSRGNPRQEALDLMAFYFLALAAELLRREAREKLPKVLADLDKVIERVKKKYPKGWDSDSK